MAAADLTPLQQRFVAEYLITLNATDAYKRAGYSVRSDNAAAVEGHKLLRNPKIAAAIAAAQAARSERTQITADQTLRELALLGFSDIGQVLDFSGTEPLLRPACEIPETARRCIALIKVRRYTEGRGEEAREVEVTEFKLWDKLSALEKIGKHLGMFKDLHEHTGKDGAPIQHEQVIFYIPTNERDNNTPPARAAGASAGKPG